MTVFPDGRKEALHGHQFQPMVTLTLASAAFDDFTPFAVVKEAMREISEEWDEKVLLAASNRHFQLVRQSETSIEFKLCGKRYLLPSDEVVLLQTENITCESLAHTYLHRLRVQLAELIDAPNVRAVQVRIEESPGQGAAFTYAKSR